MFADAIAAAAQTVAKGGLGIKDIYIEKDYWICLALKQMAEGDTGDVAVFKGGTSLTKCFGLGNRFSEDIDVAILGAKSLNGNQQKTLIRKTAKNMSAGLEEIETPETSKGSRHYKAFYAYPLAVSAKRVPTVKVGQLLVEVTCFDDPHPVEKREVRPFLTDFLINVGAESMVEKYGMQPFNVNVLDKRSTLTEKIASLLRWSLADDYELQLRAKIRHFYDLHCLMQDSDCQEFVSSQAFANQLTSLLAHDQSKLAEPKGWQDRRICNSPLMTDFQGVWKSLSTTYARELPDLAYRTVPGAGVVGKSVSELLRTVGACVE